jgi:NTE family protein
VNPLNKIVRSVRAFGRELKRQAQPLVDVALPPIAPPKIGVALGGGFARGLAHLGVLKVFEEEQIPISFIAGTSVGAVIGAGYASGISARELGEIASLVRFKDFSRWTFSRFGLFSNDKMSIFLQKILRCKTFEELRIPLAITATDIITGEAVVFTSGTLVDPVRASCAYPGMFQPVDVNGRLLVDGVLSHAVPALPLRQMGADRVISVYFRSHWMKPQGPRHIFEVIGQCFSISQENSCATWKAASDIVLEPAISEFGYDDFNRAPELIRAGEKAAKAAISEIRNWFPHAFSQPSAIDEPHSQALSPNDLQEA